MSPRVQQTLYNLPPGIGTHAFTVSSSWEECNTNKCSEAIYTISIFRSTRYPLLLGRQSECGFKPCPRSLQMTGAAMNRTPDPWIAGPTH